MKAVLINKSWLRREIIVSSDVGEFIVLYNGAQSGIESVSVNGEIIIKVPSLFILTPEIEFKMGPYFALIEVKSTFWFTLRKFNLVVSGKLIYSEGE